jgi:single-strand DNA-binding protein
MKHVKGTVNYVELIGWLGNDPEQRYTPSGMSVAEFSVATKRPSSRSEDGTWAYETDWLDVVVWDQLAESATANLRKGSRVRVIGSLRTDTWEDRDGNKRKRVYVRADDFLMLDTRTEAQAAPVVEASF